MSFDMRCYIIGLFIEKYGPDWMGEFLKWRLLQESRFSTLGTTVLLYFHKVIGSMMRILLGDNDVPTILEVSYVR